MSWRHSFLIALLAAACLLIAGCQPARQIGRDPLRAQSLRINVQGGAGFAPLMLMQRRRLLEQRVPGLSIEWKVIPTQQGVDEALASGGLDIAAGSIVSFLQTRERGIPARLMAGVAELPLGIVANRPARSLGELPPGDRIAVPFVGSQEHIMLRMAALRDLGDWQALDRRVDPRPHAEALTALLAGRDVAAHVAVTPYLDRGLESPRVYRLVEGAELAGGPSSTVVAYATAGQRERQSALFAIFVDVLREATDLAVRDPNETARLVAETDAPLLSPDAVARYLARPGVHFSTDVRGLRRLVTFMQSTGQLRHAPTNPSELAFDEAVVS